MTMLFTVNQTPATPAAAMYALLTLLESAGWTRTGDSDGTTYRSSVPWQLTTGASGTGGLDNAYAWFAIKMPGCNRSFCFQRTSTTGANSSVNWRLKYAKAAQFSGGSPSATQTPSATDEKVILGAGTNASPTMAALFPTGDDTFRYHCCADNAAPYGFLSWTWLKTTGVTGHCLGLDPLIGCAAEDTDPYVVYTMSAADTAWNNLMRYAGGSMSCWLGDTWLIRSTGYPVVGYHMPSDYWGVFSLNPINGKDDLIPHVCLVMRSATDMTWKGISTLTRSMGTFKLARHTGELLSIAAPKDGIFLGHSACSYSGTVLPWDGSSTPLI